MRPTDHLSRRRVLGAGAVAATTALAGCAGVLNQVADQFLEDVNVLNDTDSELSGTILVTASEEPILDSGFTLSGADDTDNGDNGNIRPYENIWDGAGSYAVELELTDAIDGESSGSASITIDDPDEEMLLVGLGLQDADEPIVFRVGESFTDVVEG